MIDLPFRRPVGVVLSALAVLAVTLAPLRRSEAADADCNQTLTAQIPTRQASAPTGSQLVTRLARVDVDERENLIRNELLAGNIPGFLRRLKPVTVRDDNGKDEITACVMPDYLALGSDDDYLLIPMRLNTALDVAERYGFSLPTPKLVDAIYAQSAVHLTPQPLPAGAAMRSTDYYEHHNELVRAQRELTSKDLGSLTSGDKKDVVLTARLWQNLDRVAIYGWQQRDGRPIQPLSTIHGWHYADYSHGIRLISTRVLVDHQPQSLYSALEDPRWATLLSSEGVIHHVVELVGRLRQSPRSEALASFRRTLQLGSTGASSLR